MPKFSSLAAGVAAVAGLALLAPASASAAATTKPVTVVADTKTMYYGAATPALTYTVYGLATGDKLTKAPTCSVPAHRNVGKYTITCAGATADPKKYSVKYVSAPLYVGRTPLYIGPNYTQIKYGDREPTITYATAGLVGDDKLITAPTCAVEGAHTDAGRYKVTCSGADAGDNYEIRYRENIYDVAKVALLTGPAAQTIYFGSPEPAFTATTYGLVNGEKLVKEPTCGVDGVHTHAGKYTITCTGAQATANYSLTTVTNTYQVLANKGVVVGEKAAIKRNLLNQPTGGTVRAQLYLLYPYGATFPEQTLTFTTKGTALCTATTDANGLAGCTLTAAAAKTVVKNGGYTVAYAGQGDDITADSKDVAN